MFSDHKIPARRAHLNTESIEGSHHLYRTRFGFQRECMPPPCKLKLIETHNVKGYETYRKPFVTHLQFSIVRSTSENRSTQVYINFCETDTTELSKQ